jgi:sec-independent protein translocase protein TatA
MGAPEIILILIAILLLFGGKKIPELMRGLGRGMKDFKESQNGNFSKSGEANASSTKQNI